MPSWGPQTGNYVDRNLRAAVSGEEGCGVADRKPASPPRPPEPASARLLPLWPFKAGRPRHSRGKACALAQHGLSPGSVSIHVEAPQVGLAASVCHSLLPPAT